VQCSFNNKAYQDALFDRYNIPIPTTLNAAASSRKAEFLAGRIAANHAMLQLGVKPSIVNIGKHRQPVWPAGIMASITHHNGQVFCLMCKQTLNTISCMQPGIDFESILSTQDLATLAPSIVKPDELTIIARYFEQQEHGLSVIFSAKEALFKALYPEVGRYFDFLDVRLSNVDVEHSALELSLNGDLSPLLISGCMFKVFWRTIDNSVLTWACPSFPNLLAKH
jgi:4'-phosphopantetheinyl transferase EntD